MHVTFPPGVLASGGLNLDQSGTMAPERCGRLVLLRHISLLLGQLFAWSCPSPMLPYGSAELTPGKRALLNINT